jgi:hypothetical protein
MKYNTNDTCSCWFPTEFTDNSKWKCHNCSCVTTAADNLMRYRTGIDAVPSENPRSVFWRWIGYWPLLTEGMFVSKLPSATPLSFLTRHHSMERPCASFLSLCVYTFRTHMISVICQSYSDYDDKDRTKWVLEFFLCSRRNASFNQILQTDRGDQKPNIQGILRIFSRK